MWTVKAVIRNCSIVDFSFSQVMRNINTPGSHGPTCFPNLKTHGYFCKKKKKNTKPQERPTPMPFSRAVHGIDPFQLVRRRFSDWTLNPKEHHIPEGQPGRTWGTPAAILLAHRKDLHTERAPRTICMGTHACVCYTCMRVHVSV